MGRTLWPIDDRLTRRHGLLAKAATRWPHDMGTDRVRIGGIEPKTGHNVPCVVVLPGRATHSAIRRSPRCRPSVSDTGLQPLTGQSVRSDPIRIHFGPPT